MPVPNRFILHQAPVIAALATYWVALGINPLNLISSNGLLWQVDTQ